MASYLRSGSCTNGNNSIERPQLSNYAITGTVYLTLDLCGPFPYPPFMPRLLRIVAPGVPHHVTQRGNRRLRTFFQDGDYRAYLDLMAKARAFRHSQMMVGDDGLEPPTPSV